MIMMIVIVSSSSVYSFWINHRLFSIILSFCHCFWNEQFAFVICFLCIVVNLMTQFFLLYVFFTGVVVQFFFLGHNSWEIIQFNCIRYSWNFHHHRHYWIIDVLTILMDHWFFSVCVCVGVCLFLFLCVLCTAYGRINLRAFWQSIRDFFLLSIKYFGLRNFLVNQFFFLKKYRLQ